MIHCVLRMRLAAQRRQQNAYNCYFSCHSVLILVLQKYIFFFNPAKLFCFGNKKLDFNLTKYVSGTEPVRTPTAFLRPSSEERPYRGRRSSIPTTANQRVICFVTLYNHQHKKQLKQLKLKRPLDLKYLNPMPCRETANQFLSVISSIN